MFQTPKGLDFYPRGFDSCGVGLVCHIKNQPNHAIVEDALEILLRLSHRGACGCEENTGDGAGILVQIPDRFFRTQTASWKKTLPAKGEYGVAFLFLPKDSAKQAKCREAVEHALEETGLPLLGWRKVPTNAEGVGPTALSCEPEMFQVFVEKGRFAAGDELEGRLFLARKRMEKKVEGLGWKDTGLFYVSSFSSRTVVYKGMLTPRQLSTYFPDLHDSSFESAMALVHSRFSTNTFPSWDLAQPFRFLCHNGEINTLRGNINWMKAREKLFQTPLFPGKEIDDMRPVVREGQSDSATFDNVLEILTRGGRSLQHAMMMMIPEAWQGHRQMPQWKKDFYRYHACLMEPWDGPATIAFTDGRIVGAVLDRNGLRPSRYYVTKDNRLILASEVGVLDVPPSQVARKGRLEPGRMLFVDLEQGRIVDDAELKEKLSKAEPYGKWLKEHLVPLEKLPSGSPAKPLDGGKLLLLQKIFGYTHEDLRLLMGPMGTQGEEPIGSMGDDTPLAVLSEKPQPLFNYFKQLFAQVTNPPLDAIREELVTSVESPIGPEGNLLDPKPSSCRRVELPRPVLSRDEAARFMRLSASDESFHGFRSVVLPMVYPVREKAAGLKNALQDLFEKASSAIGQGAAFLILSDRDVDENHAPIPSLLAAAGLHHHLIRRGERTRVGLIVESAEPREVHHFCLLIGYGADAVFPYLAFDTLRNMVCEGLLPGVDEKTAEEKYIKAACKGIVKVMSKMGISTVQSYRGAQIFEAIGLSREFVDRYFTWTASRIGGIGLEEVEQETRWRYQQAWDERRARRLDLDFGGRYQWRRDGEKHLFNPETVHKLQFAARTGRYDVYQEYSRLINDREKNLCTLRALFRLKSNRAPIPIEEVEPVSEITKRFATGAMSYGSISKEAHETLAIAMNRIGGKSNTGEGGEDYERFIPEPNGDSRCSAIKQVASGRFGVTSYYLVNARELQIKIAQGAKPGEGGQLPGKKVWPWIAKTRHSTPFVGLISPPPHHDIYSIEDLAQLIYDLKNSNIHARVSVKLVAEVGVGTIAAGVAKGHADHILISGFDGGTGASPLTSIKHAGLPWELGLSETHQILVANGLRDRVVIQTDGQIRTGRDVVIAALLGAEEFGIATAALVAAGCIMMRVCHLDTCPVGVATQNPKLREKFTGKPEHVVHFMTFVAQETREIMAQLGFRSILEMVGRTECLEVDETALNWKSRKLDLSSILYRPPQAENGPVYCIREQNHRLEEALDRVLLDQCRPALEKKEPVQLQMDIRNIHRAVGTQLGAEISRRFGPEGLPDDTIQVMFRGSAGQSFMAFVPRGVTFRLEGDANDYFGKGLCGGKAVVFPPKESDFVPEDNVVIGNVAFYGATSGEAYIRGKAGERFCVRNSGVTAVVEGVGDHGCEYMTGGRVVILGATGRNFAAGMSGGVAYVWNAAGTFQENCNVEMVDLEELDEEDESFLLSILQRHHQETGSTPAKQVLEGWDRLKAQWVKVMPRDYKRALEYLKRGEIEALAEKAVG